MGARCIRAEDPSESKSPVFVYQNMVKLTNKSPISAHYKLEQMIGRGTYAEVYKARCLRTNLVRAVKKVDRRKNNKIQTLLLNEFDILRQLDHPHILKMYALYQQHAYFYIVTQLCSGLELFDLISKRKTFKESDAAELFYQLCSATRYLHQSKVMHRDLKPENIMVDEKESTIKLVDFGSALKFDTNIPQQRRRIGTSYYIAPEVLSRVYNQKCDVWSAGIILYVLLCGQPPFKGTSDDQILKKVAKAQLGFSKPIWESISNEAKDLISHMLDKDIQKRYSMQKAMNHEWFNKKVGTEDQTQDEKNLTECLNNMRIFKDVSPSNSIQEGMLIFIVNFVRNNKDQAELMRCFKAMDLNGDGVLSLQELTVAMSRHLKVKESQAEAIAKKIFQKVDTNKSGFIDYSEFVVSAVGIEVAISENNLDTAFDFLDYDRSGTLSVTQIRQKLGQNVSESTYSRLISEFDTDKDGQISRSEFKAMMRKILKTQKKKI